MISRGRCSVRSSMYLNEVFAGWRSEYGSPACGVTGVREGLRAVAVLKRAVPDPFGNELEQRVTGPVDDLYEITIFLSVLVKSGNIIVKFLSERDIRAEIVIEAVDRRARLKKAGDKRLGIVRRVPAAVEFVNKNDDPLVGENLLEVRQEAVDLLEPVELLKLLRLEPGLQRPHLDGVEPFEVRHQQGHPAHLRVIVMVT